MRVQNERREREKQNVPTFIGRESRKRELDRKQEYEW